MNKTMKNLIIVTMLVGATTVTTMAASIGLNINGKAVDGSPVSENGRTLVPLRIISENLGAKVNYTSATKRVDVTLDGTTVSLTIGSKDAKVNGKSSTLDVPAKTIKGSTYVPIRFIGEALNAKVDYKNGTVYVTSTKEDNGTDSKSFIKNYKNVKGIYDTIDTTKVIADMKAHIHDTTPYEVSTDIKGIEVAVGNGAMRIRAKSAEGWVAIEKIIGDWTGLRGFAGIRRSIVEDCDYNNAMKFDICSATFKQNELIKVVVEKDMLQLNWIPGNPTNDQGKYYTGNTSLRVDDSETLRVFGTIKY